MSPTIGDDGSRQYRSVSPVFVRVFCNLVLVLVMVEHFSHKSSIVSLLSVNQYTFPIYIRKCTCFSPTIGGDGSRQYCSDALVFARVFWNYVLFLALVENFSHKSSIVSLLSVNPFSFPFSTLLSFYKLFPFVLVTPDINVRYNCQM